MKRLVIIDGNSLINRAYYAMQRPMITANGMYTQGIFGFLNMLYKVLEDYGPEYLAVAWDLKGPTFRHEAYGEYKAGRKKMPMELAMELPVMKDILTAMRIPNLELEGFEGDDIIGTLARQGEAAGLDPLIITGDKDALQLATDVTQVLITKKGISEFDLFDRAKMLERYELTPEQFIDLKGLMGDSSDNIPGIPGVGEKTGIKLLKQFGSVANLLANTEEIANAKLREKVETYAQQAAMSRRLAEINTQVPLDIELSDLLVEEPDYDRLRELYLQLEFKKFLGRLKGKGSSEAADSNGPTGNTAWDWIDISNITTIEIQGDHQLDLLDQIPAESRVALQVFSDGNHVERPVIFGLGLLTETGTYYRVHGAQEQLSLLDSESGVDLTQVIDRLAAKALSFVGHDLIQSYYPLACRGMGNFVTGFDTAVAAYVLDPSRSKYLLEDLVLEYFHREWTPDDTGLAQCAAVLSLVPCLEAAVQESGQAEVLQQVELPLIGVLAAMEEAGFAVDRTVLETQGKALTEQIQQLAEDIYALAGETFNIQSPAQLGTILFEKLELPAGKKTKKGYSTSADILEKLRDAHPIVDKVLRYRTLSKLNSTYVEGLKPLIGADGRIRAHFQQTVTATGRLSCTEPNLQNIPIRDENGRQIRKAFLPSEGHILVGADYSQIELRVMAHLSGDENLIRAFADEVDIHRMTASRVFDIPFDQVTSLDRSRAKAVNFGVLYGMSGFGLSEELSITRKDAERYIQEYFAKHQAVKDYMDRQVAGCKETGYTTTILGRRRYIREIGASQFMVRQMGERLAMNSPIQGSAADIIKLAMIRVDKALRKGQYASRLILQVHDELIIDTVLAEQKDVEALLVREMEAAMTLSVRLKVDENIGESWYLLK